MIGYPHQAQEIELECSSCLYRNQLLNGMVARLPDFIKDSKNRELVLKKIKALRGQT